MNLREQFIYDNFLAAITGSSGYIGCLVHAGDLFPSQAEDPHLHDSGLCRCRMRDPDDRDRGQPGMARPVATSPFEVLDGAITPNNLT